MLTFDGCDPGANAWVEKYFHDCVMDYRDAIGFVLGLCSILVWLTAQLPQFISNVKNQSSEALSIWFLVEWFAGDTLNLLGCLIQGQQLPTTTILAAYFVLMDVIMLLQYIYYGALQARRQRLRAKTSRRRHGHRHASAEHYHSRSDAHQQASPLLQNVGPNTTFSNLFSSLGSSSALPTPAEGPSVHEAPLQDHQLPQNHGRAASPGDAPLCSNPLRTITIATAAGFSVMCVTALTLHPGATSSPPGSTTGGRQLLATQPLLHNYQGPDALLPLLGGDHDLVLDPHGLHSSSSALRPAATSAGAALSSGARSLTAVLYPAAAAAVAWTRSDYDDDSGGGGGGGGGVGCRFLNCDVALVAGTAMGYLSTCFYLASRVSQIRKNLARKSTEGLSPFMFMLTMSANLCTGISIVLRLRSLEQLKEQLPWMCGTFGTIALDMTLFYQAMTLGQGEHGHQQHHHHHHQHGQGHGYGGANTHAHGGRPGEVNKEGCSRKLGDLEAPLLTAAVADVEDAHGGSDRVAEGNR